MPESLLIFPAYPLRTRSSGEVKEVWDEARKKWIVLTPEEFVRQHLIHFLHHDRKIPFGLMSVERGLKVNNLFRRADVVVYDREGNPLLIAECKAPSVSVSQDAFDQAARYNITLKVPYLVITNGLKLFCCLIDFEKQSYSFLKEIPSFDEMQIAKG